MLTVASGIDVVRQLGHGNLEPRLDSGHHLLVALRRQERNRETLCTKPTCTTACVRQKLAIFSGPRTNLPDTMEVRVSIRGAVIVDHDVHSLHIDTTTEDIG